MRVLVAEDDASTRLLLERLLTKWNYDTVVVRDGAEAWRILRQEDAPTLALLDWMMPGMDGIRLCREVRKLDRQPYTYILLLTSKTQKRDVIEGLEAGADDYLAKPFDASELRVRLRAGTRVLDLQEQLRLQATCDSLTGIWNRAAILDILRRELSRSARDGFPVGVILTDVDHFKQTNDTYGHLAGDVVLREVAQRMRSSVRNYDAVGRYGGEEFLIVLPRCNAATALSQAERLRGCMASAAVDTSEALIPVTVSVGVTAGSGTEALESLLRAADEALYRAKLEGRNRVELAGTPGGKERTCRHAVDTAQEEHQIVSRPHEAGV